MCGICGVYDPSGEGDPALAVERMNRLAEHRGPDGCGAVTFAEDGSAVRLDSSDAHDRTFGGSRGHTVGLGHRRLAIIDLTQAGRQPMCDPSERYWIVYNGEVFNYLEIRSELVAGGHRITSRTDTEVVLQAYIKWGTACLERFNGMWAFAIYDVKTGAMFCARDRYGIKPFHYAIEGGRFAFASEAKQLLELRWVDRRANSDLLADLVLWGLEGHTAGTFFSGIQQLPAGHYMCLSVKDVRRGLCEAKRYWAPQPRTTLDDREAVAAFRDLLFDAVQVRMRSDVPIGVTLSGGLDSSSVTCVAGEIRRKAQDQNRLRAFNVEFEGDGFSEAHFARLAGDRAGARIVVVRPSERDLERDWSRFVWHMEQPFAGLSYFSNYQIYRLIREHGVPVILTGQGGDELLFGYERYRTYNTLFCVRSGRVIMAMKDAYLARTRANMPFPEQIKFGLYFSLPWLRAFRRQRLVKRWLQPSFYHRYQRETRHLRRSMEYGNRGELQNGEMFHYQLPHLLCHEDRVSMAHSVESRLPFLDYRLLEFVQGQDERSVFGRGWSKAMLRDSMSGILPEEIRLRTDKMGYETPTGRLFGRSHERFSSLLWRHSDDDAIDGRAVARGFDDGTVDERTLCAALSYFEWKEAFGVH